MSDYEIKTLPPYLAIGLVCNVSYTDFRPLQDTIEEMQKRVDELNLVEAIPNRLGLNYHTRQDGFVHYSVYEVIEQQILPEGMVDIKIPEMTYLVARHEEGDIEETYTKIVEWIQANGYAPYQESDVSYYDDLPIKHEAYRQNTGASHFDIYPYRAHGRRLKEGGASIVLYNQHKPSTSK